MIIHYWLSVLFILSSPSWNLMEVDGLRCWQCDTRTDEGCGSFGLIREAELSLYTSECKSYKHVSRGCYKVLLSDLEAGDNAYLFCGPDRNTTMVCKSATEIHLLEGRGRNVEFCASCQEDLCNSSSDFSSNILTIFIIIATLVDFNPAPL